MINLQIANNTLEKANPALRKILTESPKAVARAINRTMDGMKTDAVRETSKRYFIKPGEVRKSLSLRKAVSGNLLGEMVSRGRRRSLSHYQLTPKTPRKNARVLGAVKREGGLKSLGNAFLVKVAGGKYTPAWRLGDEKWNVKYAMSPSIPQIVKNEETVKAMEIGAEERFSKRLDHEVMRLFKLLP